MPSLCDDIVLVHLLLFVEFKLRWLHSCFVNRLWLLMIFHGFYVCMHSVFVFVLICLIFHETRYVEVHAQRVTSVRLHTYSYHNVEDTLQKIHFMIEIECCQKLFGVFWDFEAAFFHNFHLLCLWTMCMCVCFFYIFFIVSCFNLGLPERACKYVSGLMLYSSNSVQWYLTTCYAILLPVCICTMACLNAICIW